MTTTTATTNVLLPAPSPEQAEIIDAIKRRENVVVNSVFGSGKTTTILSACAALPECRVLVLTYNSRLKLETRERCVALGMDSRVEVRSYHALAVRYYDPAARTDSNIMKLLRRDTPLRASVRGLASRKKIPQLLVLDEQQDMKPTYYALMRKFLRDLCISPSTLRVAVFGDVKQSIYEFMQADYRFLTFAPQLMGPDVTDGVWSELCIRTSFRITRPMAAFINGVDRRTEDTAVVVVKDGPPVRYLVCDVYGDVPVNEVKRYLDMGYQPEDIFVLAPSIKSTKAPPRNLENALVKRKIPCFASVGEDAVLDKDVIAGKVTFCTYHQAKGLERPVVIVLGFDSSYIEFYCKAPRDRRMALEQCPNPMYVALSRAKERLTVIHGVHRRMPRPCFPGVDVDLLHGLVRSQCLEWAEERRGSLRTVCSLDGELTEHLPLEPYAPRHVPERSSWSVTDLIRHTSDEVIAACFSGAQPLVSLHPRIAGPDAHTTQSSQPLNIPSKVPSAVTGLHEQVSDLTGIAIPSIFELRCRGTSAVLDDMRVGTDVRGRYWVPPSPSPTPDDAPDDTPDDAPDDTPDDAPDDAPGDAPDDTPDDAPPQVDVTAANDAVHRHLRLVTLYDSKYSGFHARREQIAKYEWLDVHQVNEACRRLERMLPTCSPVGVDGLVFEQPYSVVSSRLVPGVSVHLSGRADMQTVVDWRARNPRVAPVMWELKCVDTLQPEHALQLIAYAWLMMEGGGGGGKTTGDDDDDHDHPPEMMPENPAWLEQDVAQALDELPLPAAVARHVGAFVGRPAPRLYLFNICTNELLEVVVNGCVRDVLRYLVRTKLHNASRCSDEAFLHQQRQPQHQSQRQPQRLDAPAEDAPVEDAPAVTVMGLSFR